jgi:signal transduction histidine kinase
MSLVRRLLVVDDSSGERELMASLLGAAFPQSEIVLADHPHRAKAMCEDQSFDCVLSDYDMPDVDGLALATELRGVCAHMPIVLITSVGDEMLAAEALRCGVTDYLPKSRITVESLERTVERSIQICRQARLIEDQRSQIENFAYALAHDFKQPVRQVRIFSQLISEQLQGREDEALQTHLSFLMDAAARLSRLVDVMIQYTLLNKPPDLEDIDLNRTLAGVNDTLGPLLAEKDGDFRFPANVPRVLGNETLIALALQNLVVNGLHYNRSPRPCVQLTIERLPAHLLLKVGDNGIGMEASYLDEIFKPLFRLHSASEFSGTGLGLTIARNAILAQNGALWCESQPGQGSVFYVRLPVATGERKRPAKGAAPRRTSGARRASSKTSRLQMSH